MLGWMKHKLESRLLGKISVTLDMQMTPSCLEEELKSLLMKVKEESEKVSSKLNIQKTKIMVSGPIYSRQINRETIETMRGSVGTDQLAERCYSRGWIGAFQSAVESGQALIKLLTGA